jgi:hypothetical protein
MFFLTQSSQRSPRRGKENEDGGPAANTSYSSIKIDVMSSKLLVSIRIDAEVVEGRDLRVAENGGAEGLEGRK